MDRYSIKRLGESGIRVTFGYDHRDFTLPEAREFAADILQRVQVCEDAAAALLARRAAKVAPR